MSSGGGGEALAGGVAGRVVDVAVSGHGELRPHRGDLAGMDRGHRKALIEQALDRQPIEPLDRDQLDGKPGGACLMLVLCAGEPSWRSPGVRRQTGG
jgi:hypothetical protein